MADMTQREGDWRPRTGVTPNPDNILAGVGDVHPERRVDPPVEVHPMSMDFGSSDGFEDFRPQPVDSRFVLAPEPEVATSDPKDLSALESAISSELPDPTAKDYSAEPVSLVHAARDSMKPKASVPGTPPSSPPPNPGQSTPPAAT